MNFSSYEDYETQSDYNVTDESWIKGFEEYFKVLKYFEMSRLILFSIIAIVGMVGNGSVIWIAGFKMKSVSAVWFLNLAIADFLSCLFLLLYFVEWSFPNLDFWGLLVCIIRSYMVSLNMLTSVCFLMVISLDRCASTMWPFVTRIHRRIKPARIMSGVIWVVCLVSSFIYETYYFEELLEYKCIAKRYLLGKGVLEQSTQKHLTRMVLMFILPFTIILVSYSLVAHKIRARKGWNKSNRPFRVIIALVVCFFICWFPFHMASVTPDIDKTDQNPWKNVLKEEICLCLAYVNSCLNPIIYVLLSPTAKAKTFQHKMERAMTGHYDLKDDEEISSTTDRLGGQGSSAL